MVITHLVTLILAFMAFTVSAQAVVNSNNAYLITYKNPGCLPGDVLNSYSIPVDGELCGGICINMLPLSNVVSVVVLYQNQSITCVIWYGDSTSESGCESGGTPVLTQTSGSINSCAAVSSELSGSTTTYSNKPSTKCSGDLSLCPLAAASGAPLPTFLKGKLL